MAWSTRQLANLAGTTLKAIRHYHRIGLLEEPERAGNRYKQYRTEHLMRVLQIRRLRDLGLSHRQIAAMGPSEANPDAAVREVDGALAAWIEKLQRAREELALTLHHRAPLDVPADFGHLAHHLSEADRRLIMVYSGLFTPGTMDTIRAMAAVRDSTDLEFDALPADADQAAIEDLAVQIVPGLRSLQEQHPWTEDPLARSTPCVPAAGSVVRQAMTDLYNPAQLRTLEHSSRLLALSGDGGRTPDADPDPHATPRLKETPMTTPQPDSALPRRISVEEFFADPEYSHPTISPDGSQLAYLAPSQGRLNVWVRGIDEDPDRAVPVTHDKRRGISSYFWTDNPRWLLYLQDTDGNEEWHLFRADLEEPSNPAVDLTPLAPGSRVFSAEPLRDRPGTILVAMNPRPAFIDYVLLDVATGEQTPHLEQTDPDEIMLLDRSGEPAFLSRMAADGDLEFSAIDPDTGDQRLLRRMGGAEYPMGVQPQVVTKDGMGLLIGAYQDTDDLRLVRLDRMTGDESVVAAVEGRSLDIQGTAAPGVLPPTLLTAGLDQDVVAARFIDEHPRIEVLDDRFVEVHEQLSMLSDGVLGTLSSDDEGRRWVATFIHDHEPSVSWLYDHRTGESRRLFSAYPRLRAEELAPMSPVAFPARDGLPLHGFLTLPVGVESAGLPLVLSVHGGPWFHDTWGYDQIAQLLANRGCAVLEVNFRGSSGYGRRHTTAAVGEFARAMHTDLLDGLEWAVQEGYADRDRLGIMGGSYGGYAALIGVTVTPGVFAAAVDYVGVSDLANFMRTLPSFVRPHLVNNWFRYVGDPEDPAAEADMRERSPITMVDLIRTPLLVAQGANDARVVQAESDNIVESLRARGVPVEYLLAEDEGHGFENPENQIRLYRAVEEHFAEHLGSR